MLEAALAKRTALRRLYEDFAAPIDLLADAGGLTPLFLEQLSQSKGWRASPSAEAMKSQLGRAMERLLHDALDGADEAQLEKRSRAFAVMAKTLETVADLEDRIHKATGSEGAANADEHDPIGEGRSTKLVEQLEKLVGGLARSRVDAGVVGSAGAGAGEARQTVEPVVETRATTAGY